MTTGNATESISGDTTAQNTRNLIRSIYRKRRPVWIVLGIVVFIVSILIGLFVFPQSYTTTTSISLSQSDSGSPLTLLTGSSGKPKYLGPLKSRFFADQVEKAAHLKDLYHLRDEDEAVEKLQRAVRFDDNATDGLLYITTTLDAPAKMAANSEARRKKVQNTTAIVCNAYAKALKSYIMNNDNDKDLVLLKSAETQMIQARADYNAAIEKWIDFVKDTKSPSVGLSSTPGSQSPELAALQSLFVKRGTLEVEMKSTDAAISGTKGLIDTTTPKLSVLPTEDPLLAEARRRYAEALHDVKDLRIQYAETAPPVLRAKERLQLAADHLQEQAESIRNGKTSENVKRQALNVEYDTVLSQIAQVEGSIQISKASATSFERFHAEVELSLKVLEATATHQAELKVTTVSGDHRTNVVDVARPPQKSRPGVTMTILISALLAITAVLVCFGIEFTMFSSQNAAYNVEPAANAVQSEG